MKENRYSKQMNFLAFGIGGHQRLRQAEVTIVGCGALGTAIAETLTRAGVGRLHLIDFDEVEWSNLQRQQLFTEEDAHRKRLKVEAAREKLQLINNEVEVKGWAHYADGPYLREIAHSSDVIVDASDNFDTAYVINDVAYMLDIPWVYGSISGSTSIQMTMVPGRTPCFRCLYEVMGGANETCDTAGVLGPTVQITAARQAIDVMQLLGEVGDPGGVFQVEDVWTGERQRIGIGGVKNSGCITCGTKPEYPSFHENEGVSVLCGRGAVHILPSSHRCITLEDGETAMKKLSLPYKRTGLFIQGYFEEHRILLFEKGRMLIHGVSDPEEGKRVYHTIFG